MILTGDEIRKARAREDITIAPFSQSSLGSNSYNYHMGDTVKVTRRRTLDVKAPVPWKTIDLTPAGLVLSPDNLYLASTQEEIGSRKYAITLIGRSSLGRLGLFVQISAELGHIGTSHCWTLELHVTQPLRIYPGLELGQVCFWRSRGRAKMYVGKYGERNDPTEPNLTGLLR